jgi:hypothetical protein
MPIIPFRTRRPKADCSICGPRPDADQEAMRLLIDEIPQKEPACDDCLLAFWERLFAGEPTPCQKQDAASNHNRSNRDNDKWG